MDELDKKKKEMLAMTVELGLLEKIHKDKTTAEEILRKAELKMYIKDIKKEITVLSNQALSPQASMSNDLLKSARETEAILKLSSKFVRHVAKINGVALSKFGITYRGEDRSHVDYYATVQLINEEMAADYNNTAQQYNLERVPVISQTLMSAAMIDWYRELRINKRNELNAMLRHDPKCSDSTIRQWMHMMTGTDNEMYVAVIKHWMQCVKRKMLGLPIEFHLFPILVGKQGAGKTRAIAKLIEPLDGYILDFEVSQVLDKTIIGAFGTNAVVVLDELSKGDKAEMDEMKRMIAAQHIDGRPPYGRQSEKVLQNCMFIGSSNKDVKEVFKDEEMRRFAEIRTTKRSASTYDQMDSLDMLSAWRSIDENDQNVYFTSQQDAIEKHQRLISTKPVLTQWAEDVCLLPSEGGELSYRTMSTLYNSYSLWLRNNGAQYGAGPTNKFGQALQSKFEIVSEFKNKTTLYLVNSKCTAIDPRDALYVLPKNNSII